MVPKNAKQPPIPRGFTAVPGIRGYAINRAGTRVISCWLGGRATRFAATWHDRKFVLYRSKNPTKPPYFQIALRWPGRAKRYERVHILVLLTFVGPRPRDKHGCHKNGRSLDNRLRNLRWGTPQSNVDDQMHHGTIAQGERHYLARLTAATVRKIRHAQPHELSALARRYDVNIETVRDAFHRRTWKHIR